VSENPFLDPAFLKCPFPMFKQLREAAPVMYNEQMGMYLVTGYDQTREILLNPDRFSSQVNIPSRHSEAASKIVEEEGYGRGAPALQNADQPVHTAHRNLVNEAFRPKRIRQMSDYVDKIVEELLDDIQAAGSRADMVCDFAVPLPLVVIADQLGIPREKYRTFKEWSDAWLEGLGAEISEERMIHNAKLVVDMQQYLAQRIEERRSEPKEDILSDLAQANIDGQPVTTKTVMAIVEQLLVAGNETTTNGIAAGIHMLAGDKALHQRLKNNPELVKEFVEEVLRTEAPVQCLFRTAIADEEISSVKIPAESVVMVHYGAASRDESRFDNADSFDLDRPKKGAHLAFGSGIHHCIGSELARVEMAAAFSAFTQRFTSIDLIDEDVAYHATFALRGIQSLNVRCKQ
jgi:cytochrome P450